MKILLVTFDKEMEKKVRELLKGHEIIVAKNGEEALLLNIANDVDVVIYDALAGGIAEDDINKLYEEGFQNVPFIILMDDLFPIDPNNIKPKVKKIISREVDLDQLPKLVEEFAKKKGVAVEEKKEEVPAPAAAPAEEKKEEEFSWEAFGATEEKEEKKEEAPAPTPAVEEKGEEVFAAPAEGAFQPSLKKQCLLVSFDMPLVEKIQKLIGDRCDLYVARSAKQALQKYAGKPFDVIIFDTISGVFAEKGIKDLYEKGGYKDSLYVLLLDEFLPLDVDKLPVKNLTSIKRETELDLLPEIIENAPHITMGQVAAVGETAPAEEAVEEEKREEVPAESYGELFAPQGEETVATAEREEVQPQPEEVQPQEMPQPAQVAQPAPQEVQPAQPVQQPQPVAAAPAPQPAVAVSEELIERLVEQKINEKIIPLIEELVKTRLTETYIKAIAREIIEPEIDEAFIKEIVREIAEPLVREVIDKMLA